MPSVSMKPYMAKSDATFTTTATIPTLRMKSCRLASIRRSNVSYEKTNANASPAIYFDSYGHAVVPLLGGIAIRDLNAEETTTLGYFSPKQHDGGGYVIQSSYTFLDSENRIVCPTSNNSCADAAGTDKQETSCRSLKRYWTLTSRRSRSCARQRADAESSFRGL